jgi:hypothetical protein
VSINSFNWLLTNFFTFIIMKDNISFKTYNIIKKINFLSKVIKIENNYKRSYDKAHLNSKNFLAFI